MNKINEFQTQTDNSKKPRKGPCLSPKCIVSTFLALELVVCLFLGLYILLDETAHIMEFAAAFTPHLGLVTLIALSIVNLASGYIWCKHTRTESKIATAKDSHASNLRPDPKDTLASELGQL